MALTNTETLNSIASDYQNTPNLQEFAVWAQAYRSDKPQPETDWEYLDGWRVRPIYTEMTITTIIKLIDGIRVGMTVDKDSKRVYGEFVRAYPARHYWVPEKPKTVITLDDILAGIDPNDTQLLNMVEGLKELE